ncbi:response regulator [Pararhizobium qamdonense]|uniref:response regulator n=1 Tax=Pararhizobium qamdonense TaxID=3031126 RepID=UPI0023E1D16C|nr:response regulator transcription factor [Pararhizobium qamdonense]
MRLLLVEDEPEMAAAIITVLSKHGNIVDHVPTIEQGREALKEGVHEAVLLDRQLPDGDGMSLLSDMRRTGDTTPVIILTAHDTSKDRVTGLDEGADDYIGKPFVAEELLARIRAAARRASNYASNIVSEGNLSMDISTLQVLVGGTNLDLPRREALALQILIRRSGRTVMRPSLEEAVYGFADEIQSNALDSHISRLRKRLADAGAEAMIHTIRGVGYMLKGAE